MKNPHEAFGLQGRTVAVTGAGGGIGRAVACELARGGADVLVHTGSNQAGIQEVAQHIRQYQRRAEIVVSDLSSPGAQDDLVEYAWQWGNGIDAWINIAGVDVLTGPAAHLSFEEKLDRLWQVDVTATIRISRLIGNKMRERFSQPGRAVIVNMGWDQAPWGMAGDSGEMFAAVKGAVMAFTRSLAKSLAPEVRVNCLAPGWIKTAWGEQASEPWQTRAEDESLLNRWGTPEDVAAAVRFLTSPEASFITDQIVEINGGLRR